MLLYVVVVVHVMFMSSRARARACTRCVLACVLACFTAVPHTPAPRQVDDTLVPSQQRLYYGGLELVDNDLTLADAGMVRAARAADAAPRCSLIVGPIADLLGCVEAYHARGALARFPKGRGGPPDGVRGARGDAPTRRRADAAWVSPAGA